MAISDLSKYLLLQPKNILTFDGGGAGTESAKNSKNKEVMPSKIYHALTNHKLSPKEIIQRRQSQYGECSSGKRKNNEIDVYFSNHFRSSNCQTSNYVGEKQLKLDDDYLNNFSLPECFKTEKEAKECEKINLEFSELTKRNLLDKGIQISSSPLSLSALLEQNTSVANNPSSSSSSRCDTSQLNKRLVDLLQECVLDNNQQLNLSKTERQNSQEHCKCEGECTNFCKEKITPPRSSQESIDHELLQRRRCKSVSPHFTTRNQVMMVYVFILKSISR